MFYVLKNPTTDETVCTDDPDSEGDDFSVVGQSDRLPLDKEVWDESSQDWVIWSEADQRESEREWNRLPKRVRRKILQIEERIKKLEERVLGEMGND